ncbi:MAG: acyl-CoA dehydrogenase [Burkholderiaceae bacterium]|nr:acyl-CoA dehydrogenase [Burkholderiaceae bacterium]
MLSLLILIVIAAFGLILVIPALRQPLLTAPILKGFRRSLPAMSDTEKAALEAGTVWWEADLFRGAPDWKKLQAIARPSLTQEEQSFVDNEVEEACRMVNEWKINFEDHDMPQAVWDYIKQKGFLGMIIPKSYGGKGFSAYAHSQVVAKLSTRSSPLAISVMVPNSLGPAELLLHYGTEAQKDHYLPRLARGEEIPAFALTSPWAGSDAASIPDYGIVCKQMWQGKETLGMRVTWNKRYITLAPVCTILGLAFRLYDPDGLLGKTKDLGITCALVPHDHPGVQIGRRHIPMNTYFMNGPTQGDDVFMPLDFIIGGPAMAGQGWRMLMECLSAGRAISLPSANAGLSQLAARVAGGYARIRNQFKTPISRFEGIEEALARVAGNTYMNEAVRTLSAAAIDLGQRPSVVSAIAKYHVTERARQVVTDSMDVLGGKGICLGPSNIMGLAYQQMPIGITVEGANILTRSLILFGQGAIRCHPFLLAEMQAAQDPDRAKGLQSFDAAFWGHIRYTLGNGLRSVFHGLSGAKFAGPGASVSVEMRGYARQINRLSTAYAFLADISMLMLGGSLKRKEKLSARLGDILALMFLASCVIKRYEMEGRIREDADLARWCIEDCLNKIHTALDGVFNNFPNALLGRVLKGLLFPWGLPGKSPSDQLGHRIAQLLSNPGEARNRLTPICFIHDSEHDPVGVIEHALAAVIAAEPIDAKIRAAEKQGVFKNEPLANSRDISGLAAQRGVISQEELTVIKRRDELRDRVIHVDDFPFEIHAKASGQHADGSDAESRLRAA